MQHTPHLSDSYWKVVWKQFRRHPLGSFALGVLVLFCLVAIYAPVLASSKPLIVEYRGEWYFPLFRYLFYSGFYTKRLDIFFNIMMLTAPLLFLILCFLRRFKMVLSLGVIALQMGLFFFFAFGAAENPAASAILNKGRQQAIQKQMERNNDLLETPLPLPTEQWDFDLHYLTAYGKLHLVLQYEQRKQQNQRIISNLKREHVKMDLAALPTLWQMDLQRESQQRNHLQEYLEQNKQQYLLQKDHHTVLMYEEARAKLLYLEQKQAWLEQESAHLNYRVMPLLSLFHWEDPAGGNQELNQELNWWNLTRSNRKDLLSALIFGVRISLVVGIAAVALSLGIGIPVGALAGYRGGMVDIIICRWIEIWEAMPTFFMLLLVVAITQSKSVFLVIAIIGFFGWTGFCRYIRGEFFKQRHLPYVEACHAIGFSNQRIMFLHILPNAIPPLLTLVPFAVMGAIASEAGLSFLGLGEEGSCSWGVLMNEGRNAFPAESNLLWPPAILLTILLIAIALIGDALRDSLDPKMHVTDWDGPRDLQDGVAIL